MYLLFHLHYYGSSFSFLVVYEFVCLFGHGQQKLHMSFVDSSLFICLLLLFHSLFIFSLNSLKLYHFALFRDIDCLSLVWICLYSSYHPKPIDKQWNVACLVSHPLSVFPMFFLGFIFYASAFVFLHFSFFGALAMEIIIARIFSSELKTLWWLGTVEAGYG